MKPTEGKKSDSQSLIDKIKPYCKHFSDCAIWKGQRCDCGLYGLLGVE